MEYKKLTNYVKALGGIALLLLVMCAGIILFTYKQGTASHITPTSEAKSDNIITHVSDYVPVTFKNDAEGKLASYGEKLIKNTYDYFYEDGKKSGTISLAAIVTSMVAPKPLPHLM